MYEEKDYIIRLINEVIRTAVSLMLGKEFGKDKDADLPVEYTVEYKRLALMVDDGDIDSAENILIDHLHADDLKYFQMGLMLYLHMNEKSESFLKDHDFSKKEILDGVKYLINYYGYGSLMEAFVTDFGE